MDRIISELGFPTAITLGAGALRTVGAACKRLGLKKPLVMTDRGIVDAGLAARIQDELKRERVAFGVYDLVRINPSDRDAEAAVEAYLANGSDGIVALGGGSVIDAAKLVRLLVTHERPLSRYEAAMGGERLVVHAMPPMIAVPTAAGTGAEVSRRAVAMIEETGRKAVISAPGLMPTLAICDPELTLGLPAAPTAWAGMDAFAHCVEAFCATGFHPLADALAIDGAARLARSLPVAVADPANLAARTDLMVASVEGAAAAQKGLGACDALANALTAVAGVRHGLASGICLAAVLEHNLPAIVDRLAKLAVALGEPSAGDPRRLAEAAIARVRRVAKETALPASLEQADVREDQLPAVADKALLDASLATNPRTLHRDELLVIARACLRR